MLYPTRILFWALFLCVVSTVTAANAEDFSAFGFSSDDVRSFKDMAQRIPDCKAAVENDQKWSVDAVPVPVAKIGVHYHGLCRKYLEQHHAPIKMLKVNDVFIGMLCLVVGGSGAAINNYPACNTKSHY